MVTISASYGAGGSVIAPAVAERLGFPFLDRALPAAASSTAAESADDEERTEGLITRMLSRFAAVPDPLTGGVSGVPGVTRDEVLKEQVEHQVGTFSRSDGVILGWGSTLIVESAFHVRLDGPEEARVRRGMMIEGLDEGAARKRLADTDRVRSLYIRRMYGRDWRDFELYQLMLDSTSLDFDGCVTVIADTARAFWAYTGRPANGPLP
ncbi:MAG TPA: cytidylate kinase-like family protein [Acidimicrobiales bacterium]|nr:cytidylate kinase-like family protein [Acidimicrobiales bacterium]